MEKPKNLQEVEEKFLSNFKDWRIHHKTIPCIKDDFVINEIKQFISDSLTSLLEGLRMEKREERIMCDEKYCNCESTGYDDAVKELDEKLDTLLNPLTNNKE